jgi:hypothetical protein
MKIKFKKGPGQVFQNILLTKPGVSKKTKKSPNAGRN